MPVWQPRRDLGSAAPRGGGTPGASRAGARDQLRSRRHAGALSGPPCQRFPLVVYPPSRAFSHPRARRLTPCSRFETAEEGLARARRGALRRVADGGGVLLRRQVRREGAVRFPGRILRASTRNSSRGSRFAKTTLIQHRESRSPSPPCSRAQGETLQAHQRASHGVRDPLRQGDRKAQGEQKAPRRGAGTPSSPPRRKAAACRVSRISPPAPVCLTPSPSAASREKASHGELAESRGDQETLRGFHLESRREPGAPEQRPDRGTRDVRRARAEPFSAFPVPPLPRGVSKRRLSREKRRFSRAIRSIFLKGEKAPVQTTAGWFTVGRPPRRFQTFFFSSFLAFVPFPLLCFASGPDTDSP